MDQSDSKDIYKARNSVLFNFLIIKDSWKKVYNVLYTLFFPQKY